MGLFLEQQNWSKEKIALAASHIISRTVYPASEYKTASFIKENSAVCELTGYDENEITKDQLYKITNELYSIKDPMEQYRANSYFYLCDYFATNAQIYTLY